MKTTLINPYGMSYYGEIRYPSIFPLGLAQIMAAAKQRGHEVDLLDCDLDDIKPDSPKFRTEIEARSPDIVGVPFWTFNKHIIHETLTVVKDLKDTITVVGGPDPSVNKGKCVKHPAIDYGFIGEAETGFPMLIEALESKSRDYSHIPGLIYTVDGVQHVNPQAYPSNFSDFEVDYDAMQLRKYHELGYNYGPGNKVSAPIQATRGCPYQCQFCSASIINGTQIRVTPIPKLVSTINRLYHSYGVRAINFVDDNFTFYRDYVMGFCEAIKKEGHRDLTFSSPNGVHLETLDYELLQSMWEAGWRSLMVSPESGSNRTLTRMKKRVDLEDVPRKVQMIKDAGMLVTGSFIIGYPGETMCDIELTSVFTRSCGFDMISVNKFQPLPGTPVFNELVECGEIAPDFIPVDTMGSCKYAPRGMTPEQLDRVHRGIYLKFYSNPLRVYGTIKSAGIKRSIKRLLWLYSPGWLKNE